MRKKTSQIIPTAKQYATLSSESQAWKTLSKWLQPSNPNAEFWWNTTGPVVATMLMQSGYSPDAQYEGLLFHYQMIAPEPGPRPNHEGKPGGWKSFMTDDFSPMELSWSWDSGGLESKPKLRYSVEATSPRAGSANDPFDQIATLRLVDKLRSICPKSDWEWFDQLSEAFRPCQVSTLARVQTMPSGSNQSSMFLGFEYQENGVGVKAYLAPTKAAVTQSSPLKVITEGIRGLENEVTKFPAYDRILQFLSDDSEGSELEVLGIALDCVDPSKARLKLYVRSGNTSFDSVDHIIRMGGGGPSTADDTAMGDLFSLWKSVLGYDETFPSDIALSPIEHQTSGILYNFEIKAGSTAADPKVYIPIKHYAPNDLTVAHGLMAFLKKRSRDQFTLPYLQTLECFCSYSSLEDSRGLQTYFQCGLQKDSISLTSYLAPEIYSSAKWSAQSLF